MEKWWIIGGGVGGALGLGAVMALFGKYMYDDPYILGAVGLAVGGAGGALGGLITTIEDRQQ